MPKDATKNIDRYKIRGGALNEFDFQQSQAEYVKEKTTKATKGIKTSKSTKAVAGASAKKLAARKAAKKK